MNLELCFDAKAMLGEGPAWDEKAQTLYWVDILKKRIYAGSQLLAELDEYIGCLAPCKNGNLILGKRASFTDFDLASSQQTVLASVNESATNRMNDGKCDPAGRFLAGTMDMNEKDPTGSVYSFDGASIKTLFRDVTISNGMAWSPDYKTFYYIDTPACEVRAYDYDLKTGEIANRRKAFDVPNSLGWADGMTSDVQGNLWIAMWGGARVTRWNPNTGQLLEQFPVPALQPSCPVFGGKDLNELYVTSARKDMSEADLQKYPLSGALFKAVTKYEGMPTFEFGQ
ncbi:MAG: SMP-30/gluconolactonase/LRE family protein [Chloroflexi bacterium]|nr:SMP-30/gluconolactonase/LRE family protein [Chloroflexota bacterium]